MIKSFLMLPTYFRIISKSPVLTFKCFFHCTAVVLLSRLFFSPVTTVLLSIQGNLPFPESYSLSFLQDDLYLGCLPSSLIGELLLILQNPDQMSLLLFLCLFYGEMCFHSIPFSPLCLLPLYWELCNADTRAYPPRYPQYLECSEHCFWQMNE